ncbi:MAG: hypothetical protein S4CHLAM7_05260 [Chlamydiae bacterium]|nr:hypothetical protein [Chlamydiota bacterium]
MNFAIAQTLFSAFPSFTKKEEKIKETKWLKNASSKNGHGEINMDYAKDCLKKIQKAASPGVSFHADRLEKVCYGGTCSTQSLNFIEKFLSSKENDFHEKVIESADQCVESSLILRTEQAALNTIIKDPSIPSEDFSKAKVESILGLKSYNISYASEPINDNLSKDLTYKAFEERVTKLPEGIYFVRMLRPTDNEKEEIYGHSVVFLNFDEGHYFWNPMGGLTQIASQDVVKSLYNCIERDQKRFLLKNPRFYRISQEQPSIVHQINKLCQSSLNYLKAFQSRILTSASLGQYIDTSMFSKLFT